MAQSADTLVCHNGGFEDGFCTLFRTCITDSYLGTIIIGSPPFNHGIQLFGVTIIPAFCRFKVVTNGPG
ncbi:MAG: hypothetical protein IPI96_15500 [Saprospiraceae bacterium]|nr:hypothetical protein [Saprospiraceae bacterium]